MRKTKRSSMLTLPKVLGTGCRRTRYDPQMAVVVGDQPGLVSTRSLAEPAVLSRRSVLSLYWLIPAVIAIVAIDGAMGSPLQQWLPRSPESWVLFTLFFGTPHIVASSLMLFGIADYRRHFRKQILWWSAGIGAALAVLNAVVSYDVLYALIAAWTVKHVLGQQFGIGNSVARCKGWAFKTWLCAGLATGTLAFVTMHSGSRWDRASLSYAHRAIVVGVAIVVLLGAALAMRCASREGRMWIAANSAVVCVSVLMLLLGYPFFTVLIPRIIHDSTAFMVYSVHERNRATAAGRKPLGLVAVGAAATLLVSLLLERVLNGPVASLLSQVGVVVTMPTALYIAGFLGLLHYCSEAVTWRSGSPYRAHFSMT